MSFLSAGDMPIVHTMPIVKDMPNNGVNDVHFSPDGSKLALALGDNKLKVWDVSTGTRLHMLEGYPFWVNIVQFSPDFRPYLVRALMLIDGFIDVDIASSP